MQFTSTGRALRRGAIALGAASLLLLSACTTGSEGPGDTPGGGGEEDLEAAVEALEPRTLIFASWQQSTNPAMERLKRIVFDEVTEQTDGKLSFEIYTDATLVPSADLLKATGDGVADISDALAGATPQVLPGVNFLGTASYLWGTDWPRSVILGSMAMMEVLSNSEQLQAEYDAVNVVSVGGTGAVGYPLYCSRELGEPPLGGTLIRSGAQYWNWEIEEALGAAAVTLTPPEIYEGIQRGVADCAILTPPTGNPMGLHEVAGHFYPTHFSGYASGGTIFNKDTWNSLAPAIQNLFTQQIIEYQLSGVEQSLADYGALAGELTEEFGIQWHDASALNEALNAWHDSLEAGELQNRAPAGVDADALVADLKAAVEKWNAILEAAGMPAENTDTAEATQAAWIEYQDYDVAPIIEAIKENL